MFPFLNYKFQIFTMSKYFILYYLLHFLGKLPFHWYINLYSSFILTTLKMYHKYRLFRTYLKFGTAAAAAAACNGGGTLYGNGSLAATAGFSNSIFVKIVKTICGTHTYSGEQKRDDSSFLFLVAFAKKGVKSCCWSTLWF